MSGNQDDNSEIVPEPVALVAQGLSDSDLSSLTLTHSNDQFMSSDYETLANIEAQLECMNAEEVMTTEETHTMISESTEDEIVLPDVEMTEVSEEEVPSNEIVYTPADQGMANLILQAKPSIQMVSSTAPIQPKTTVTPSGQTQSIMIVSPAGGGGASQILKISHPASASPDQLQSIAQSLITGKSPDGTLLQMRQTVPSNKIPIAPKSSSLTVGGTHKMKTVTSSSGKRTAQSSQPNRNVITKMVLANTPSQSGQQVLLTSPSSDGQIGQAIKLLTSSASNLGSPTKITFAQAQQMGLIPSSPGKIQHILPSTVNKQTGIFMNKLVQSTTAQPAKLTMFSNAAKSPTKILPAPPVSAQLKSGTSQTITLSSTSKIMPQNQQKIIIRQNSVKSGTVNHNPIISIPTNQNIVSDQLHQVQVPGRPVQYVRFVNTPPSTTTNVVTVGKSRTPTIAQTSGATQKTSSQQQLVKVVPLNTTTSQPLRSVAPKVSGSGTGQRLIIPASATIGAQSNSNTLTIPASALSQLASGQAVLSGSSNIVVLPAQYLQQTEEGKSPIPRTLPSTAVLNTSQGSQSSMNSSGGSIELKSSKSLNSDSNGIRPRKPCNCTKSQCLKLYCDCFANGEFCHMCNCNNCSNNLGNEEERQRAIRSCLERNPNAFRPKIGKGRDTGEDVRRHNKGCNCKRSGCLKNYCECYEAKIPCSENCKCVGCRNIEEPIDKKLLKELTEAMEVRTQMNLKSRMPRFHDTTFRPPALSNTGSRQPFNFLTDKVVEMTCQCLIAQAEEAERNMLDDEASQKLIIEEFGRCLKEIIESAHKAEGT